MPDSAVKILRGASFLVFDTSVSALVGILAFALISRLITRTEMGIMTVLLMVTSTCQLISTMGLSSASTKFIAEAMGQGDVKTACAVASKVLKVALAFSSVMALMCFVSSEDLSRLLLGTPQHQILFQVLAANIFFSGLLPLLTGILLGLKQLRSLAVFGLISFSLQQGLVVVLLFLHMGLFGVVLGWTVANAFNCTVFIWSISQSLALPASEEFSLRALLGYSWPLYAVAFVSLLDNWFDRVLLLGYPLGELGAYNVAFKAFGYLYAIPIVISDGFFPHLSELRMRWPWKVILDSNIGVKISCTGGHTASSRSRCHSKPRDLSFCRENLCLCGPTSGNIMCRSSDIGFRTSSRENATCHG